MSRIKGLNDRATLQKKPPVCSISVWKGAKKTHNRAGTSLGSEYRIEAPDRLKSLLKTAYNAREQDGSLFVDGLNIVLAYSEVEKAFTSQMASFTASRPVLFCDRQTIHTKFVERRDPYGNVNFQPVQSEEACPVAGTNFNCPNKCMRQGTLYFYIFELSISGCADLARLNVGSVSDNQHLAEELDRIKFDIGSIKISPFVSEKTRSYVVFHLSKRLVKSKFPILENGVRTGKRGTKDEWVVDLKLHPIWQEKYQAHLLREQLLLAGVEPSVRLIEQIYDAECISVSKEVQALPGAVDLQQFKSELAIAFKNNGWNTQGAIAMLRGYFDTAEVHDGLDLELLLNIAKSAEERKKWCGS